MKGLAVLKTKEIRKFISVFKQTEIIKRWFNFLLTEFYLKNKY